MGKKASREAEEDEISVPLEGESPGRTVVSASYIASMDKIAIVFTDGIEIAFPRAMFKELKNATPAELAKIELLPGGDGLDWPGLDVSYSASNMIADTFADDDSCRAYSVKANRAQLIRELVAEMGPPNKRALSIIDELMQGEPMTEGGSRTDANRAAYVASIEAKHGSLKKAQIKRLEKLWTR